MRLLYPHHPAPDHGVSPKNRYGFAALITALLGLALWGALIAPLPARALDIIGDDDRISVMDLDDPRLIGLVKIEAWFKDHTRHCSGVLTATAGQVLTAAHCATNYPYPVVADSVWVLVPTRDLADPWKRYRVESLLMHKSQDSGDALRAPGERIAGDLVILQITIPEDAAIPQQMIGAPAMGSLALNEVQKDVAVIGWGQQTEVGALTDECDLLLVGRYDSRAHLCDTVEGMSGSPMYRRTNDGSWVLVGLHTRSGPGRNLARLLTRDELLDLKSVIKGRLNTRDMRRFTRFILLHKATSR